MSIEITNLTPFPNMRFSNLDMHGKEFGVFMVKGAWDIPKENNTSCILSDEQEPFVFTDEYHGELNFSSMRYPSDFVPYKPTTDIIFDATAYAPKGEPAVDWLVGVRVEDEDGYVVEKTLRILGPRYWVPKWKRKLNDEEKANWRDYRDLFEGWELSEPEPITKLPIRYEYAYGGYFINGEKEDGSPNYEVYEENLVGRGWLHPEFTDHTKPQPAPQIEDPKDPITRPYKHYKPQSFGPIPPSWKPRLPLGGTYDQNWIDNIHPNWPPDYDFAYHNAASRELKATKYLAGDLKIQLVGLHPQKRHWKFELPDPGTVVLLDNDNGDLAVNTSTMVRAPRDILFFEVADDDAEDPRIYCNWRVVFDPVAINQLFLASLTYDDRKLVKEGELEVVPPFSPDQVSVPLTFDQIESENV